MMLIATRPFRYRTRDLAAGDTFEASGRDARVLKAIRRAKDAPAPEPKPEPVDPLVALRAEYTEVVGKRPGPMWDEATIRAKMAEHLAEDDED